MDDKNKKPIFGSFPSFAERKLNMGYETLKFSEELDTQPQKLLSSLS